MMDLRSLDAHLSQLGAELVGNRPAFEVLFVFLATSNLAKALLFAPWLLIWWYDTRAQASLRRQRVLATLGSCATALLLTWCSTSFWHRPRPLDPRSGLLEVSEAFASLARQTPGWLHWGCFPSDHAAYLTALGLGLFTIDRRVGTASLCVGLLGNGLARSLVGLHYLSDLIGGVMLGALAHGIVFRWGKTPCWAALGALRSRIEARPWLQVVLVLVVIEMAVLFQDLRWLDAVLFPTGA